MRLALTLAAVVLGLTVVLAVTFYEPKETPTEGDEQSAGQTDTDSANGDADADAGADPVALADTDADDVTTEPDPAAQDPDDAGGDDPDTVPDTADAETNPDAEDATADTGTDAEPAPQPELHARFTELEDRAHEPVMIGSIEDGSPYMLRAELSPYRAGLLEVQLANYFEQVDQVEHHTLIRPVTTATDTAPAVGSYAARSIIINGQYVPLYEQDAEGSWSGSWEVAEQSAGSVTFRLVIASGPVGAPTPIAEITRTYTLDEGSYSVQLAQSVRNLTDAAITVQWEQFAQGDITWDSGDYLRGRSRQYVLGYFNLERDPRRFSISVDDGYIPRHTVVDNIVDGDWASIWPNPKIDPEQKELAWLASVNRYFTVVTSGHVPADAEESATVPALDTIYPTIGTILNPSATKEADLAADERTVLFTLLSEELTVAPSKSTRPRDLGLDIFVGPRKQAVFNETPYGAMRLNKLIRYSLGGMCGFCTFQWLADGLMGLLKLFHTMLFDWGVAIILLVLIVRVCLHPITKRGQIGMMKMGKQMAAIQPDVQKLKKKYADNPQKMQQEQMKLFREKGINPAAGALGCLPMMLQMPIWIALYAMLYYAIELRHEPAFYGFFQLFGGWNFLSDLSRSDHFITFFKEPQTLNLLFIRFDYSALNILPLLMAVTFYINMKFTTPPPANEQQAQQQKIMRIMPFLFPIMLYSAPSGLTLYICASTAAGIIDSYIVRKHVKELEDSGKLFEKKQPKPGGIMHKIQMAAEKAQQAQQERDKPGGKGDSTRGPQNFKKRKR